MMKRWITSALCVLVLGTGCSDDTKWSAVNGMIDARFGDVPQITTDSLAQRLNASGAAEVVLLDARTEEEYAVSHLPSARRLDPSATSFPELDSLNRATPIVVYCSVGYRSARTAQRLREQGFSNVSNLQGSIFRWANEGRPVVRGDSSVRQVHPYDDTWGDLLRPDLRAYTPSPAAGGISDP